MDENQDMADGPVFTAQKKGTAVEFPRDPHPLADQYLVVEAPGLLVLFPNDTPNPPPSPSSSQSLLSPEIRDREEILRRAFRTLEPRISPSVWTSSAQPFADLADEFRRLIAQEPVRQDIATYISENPSLVNAIEMLFTSVAMSARADWRAVPEAMRSVAARGWFLGRWIPTFLVLDGPIMRFLKSQAFRRQQGSAALLRAVRTFFDHGDFWLLRHAFAHWSFSWITDGTDSSIVAIGKAHEETRVSRSEADAFHIITFAVVEAIHDVFVKQRS